MKKMGADISVSGNQAIIRGGKTLREHKYRQEITEVVQPCSLPHLWQREKPVLQEPGLSAGAMSISVKIYGLWAAEYGSRGQRI